MLFRSSETMDKKAAYLHLSKEEIRKNIGILESQMLLSAKELDFERAAELRDVIFEMRKLL